MREPSFFGALDFAFKDVFIKAWNLKFVSL